MLMFFLFLNVMLLCKRQCYPSVDAQQDDEQGLYGVNDEHEVEGVVLLDAIEDKHRLHCEMPWTRSIGCRYDYSYEGDVERYVSHALQRDYSLPESVQRSFHLIIYSQFLEQYVSQEEYGDAADGGNQVSCGCEVAQDAVHARARLVEEVQEDGNLHQEYQSCDK